MRNQAKGRPPKDGNSGEIADLIAVVERLTAYTMAIRLHIDVLLRNEALDARLEEAV